MSIAMSAEGPSAAHAANMATETDRNYSVAIHLAPLAAFVFAPLILASLVLWLVRKDESPFVDDHGRETVNALISFVIYHFIAIVSVIGIVALPVLYVVGVVNLIRGAVAAGRGEFFRYPMTMRLLS